MNDAMIAEYFPRVIAWDDVKIGDYVSILGHTGLVEARVPTMKRPDGSVITNEAFVLRNLIMGEQCTRSTPIILYSRLKTNQEKP